MSSSSNTCILNHDCDAWDKIISNMEFWDINNYPEFVKSAYSNDEKCMLSTYTEDDLIKNRVTTYKLKFANIGFALKPDEKGIDIILVHNSSDKYQDIGIMKYVMQLAIKLGGDHFDFYETPKLKHLYSNLGFEEYDRFTFDPQYASVDWDYYKFGEPDVVYVKKS